MSEFKPMGVIFKREGTTFIEEKAGGEAREKIEMVTKKQQQKWVGLTLLTYLLPPFLNTLASMAPTTGNITKEKQGETL